MPPRSATETKKAAKARDSSKISRRFAIEKGTKMPSAIPSKRTKECIQCVHEHVQGTRHTLAAFAKKAYDSIASRFGASIEGAVLPNLATPLRRISASPVVSLRIICSSANAPEYVRPCTCSVQHNTNSFVRLTELTRHLVAYFSMAKRLLYL